MILISIKEQVKKYYTYLPGRNLHVKKVEEDKEKKNQLQKKRKTMLLNM